jgi:membrane protein implicated in regulation of membrane protease activity
LGKKGNYEIYIVLAAVIPAIILSAVYLPWWLAIAGAIPLAFILVMWYKRTRIAKPASISKDKR